MTPIQPNLLELFHKSDVVFPWRGRELRLALPHDVFSSQHIDRGSLLLLKTILEREQPRNSALDVGCGYGTLALALASAGLAEHSLGIDRDAVAIAFARANAEQNGLTQAEFRGGLAYSSVGDRTFDLVIANLPAKAGVELHEHLLLGAEPH